MEIKIFKCKSCGGIRSTDGKDIVDLVQENASLHAKLYEVQRQVADENSGESSYERHLRHENKRLVVKLEKAKDLIHWLDSNMEHFTSGVNNNFKSSIEEIEVFWKLFGESND